MSAVRRPAVASTLYPASAVELEGMVQIFLADAPLAQGPVPKALIAPHASYAYAGLAMACAYARVKPSRRRVERVVLLGPAHYLPVVGLATTGAEFFTTPIGELTVDRDAIAELEKLPNITRNDAAHGPEHSLEVHLPFVITSLGFVGLVPLLVGANAMDKDVERALDRLWGGDETLIVVSSDLSHNLAYDAARLRDDATTRAIEALDPESIGEEDACGRTAIRGLLRAARKRELRVETLDRRSSGDAGGDRDEVVGYGAYALL